MRLNDLLIKMLISSLICLVISIICLTIARIYVIIKMGVI